jgi:uncharacterized protein YueI
VADAHLVNEKNKQLAGNNHLTGSRKLFPEESRAYSGTVRRQIAMNIEGSSERINDQ